VQPVLQPTVASFVTCGGITQDYAKDFVNGLRATARTPEALAEAMLVLGSNSTLRGLMRVSAREDVVAHHSVGVVYKNNAKIFRRIVAAKLVDAHMSMDLAARIWTQAEVSDCGPYVVMNPVVSHSSMYCYVCEADVVGSSDALRYVQPSTFPLLNSAQDVLYLEMIVSLTPTAAPIGMEDVFGSSGIELRQNAVALFLERHNRRSVLCVSVWVDGQDPLSSSVCSVDIGSLVVSDEWWDVPPFAKDMPPETVVTDLLWPRLRMRVVVSPQLLGAGAVHDLGVVRVNGWIRDRDDPSVVYCQSE
jgi:hypothetical protein